ncbi:MAG: hypothetical protein ACRD1K_17185, partial [Acidimicrobiales bacterium]
MLHTKHSGRAEAEAAALVLGACPGVVELVDALDGVVRTRWVEGRTLASVVDLAAEEVAGVSAAIASTLAGLHERGVVHGGLDPTHVLLTPEGRPVLCSFGRGGHPEDDIAALGAIMAALVDTAAAIPGHGPAGRRHRALGPMLAPPAGPALASVAAAARDADPRARPTARELATAIAEQVPAAHLP